MPASWPRLLSAQDSSSSGGRGALLTVLERSRLLCYQRYEKELRGTDAYLRAYQRLETPLSPKQLAAFAGLWAVWGLLLVLLTWGVDWKLLGKVCTL